MSLKKNISGGTLDVPLLGRSVEDGETVRVPDFQPAHTEDEPLPIAWPPDKWQDVDAEGYATGGVISSAEAALVGEGGPGLPVASPDETEGM